VGLAVVAKVLGLGKDIVVAAGFGTSFEMDAYLVAFTVPTLIIAWLRSPIRAGFIPHFTESIESDGEVDAWKGAGVLVTDLFLIVAVLAGIAMAAAPAIVSVVAPGFDSNQLALATTLTRIMLISVLFATGANLCTDILHCYRNFALPGLARPLNNLMMIGAAVFLTVRFGILGLAFGVVLGSAAMFFVQLPAVIRRARGFAFRVDFTHPMFLGVVRLAMPLLIGMAGAKLDDVIDRMFASMLSEGSISGLSYALRLIELPKEVLVVGFSTVLFPFFSTMAARGKIDELGEKLMLAIRVAFYILLPVSIGMALLGEPFVRLIFQRGAFDEQSVSSTTSALLLYTPTIWALGISSIMTAAFISMKDTRRPVIAGFARLGLKIALVWFFVRIFEHAGVALATSVSHVFKLVLFFILLPRELRQGRYGRLFKSFLGTVLATAAMGGGLFLLARAGIGVEASDPFAMRAGALAGMGLLGVLFYWLASLVVARSELRATVKAVRRGLGDVASRVRRPRKGE
ncbi:murein biosynthesis integral membrane protein MurJ, partial [bacterium]|nr:murein biosynthesis integral membrane protein MurJ [bacterium]